MDIEEDSDSDLGPPSKDGKVRDKYNFLLVRYCRKLGILQIFLSTYCHPMLISLTDLYVLNSLNSLCSNLHVMNFHSF